MTPTIADLPKHIKEARARGLEPTQMMDNVDNRIEQAARFIVSSAQRYPSDWEQRQLEKLFAEVRELRDYRAALLDKLMAAT